MEHIRTESDYNTVVSNLADSAIELAEELATSSDYDNAYDALYDAIHETVDNSYYMTYTRFHLPIIQFCTNPDAWQDRSPTTFSSRKRRLDWALADAGFKCFELTQFVKEGLGRLHCVIAFCALIADVEKIACERINKTK